MKSAAKPKPNAVNRKAQPGLLVSAGTDVLVGRLPPVAPRFADGGEAAAYRRSPPVHNRPESPCGCAGLQPRMHTAPPLSSSPEASTSHPNTPDNGPSPPPDRTRQPISMSLPHQKCSRARVGLCVHLEIGVQLTYRLRTVNVPLSDGRIVHGVILVMIGPPGGVVGEYRCQPGSMVALSEK